MPYWAVEYFDQNLHQVVLGIFKPESASIFLTSPVYILCNYRKSQISYCDILHEVENSSTNITPDNHFYCMYVL